MPQHQTLCLLAAGFMAACGSSAPAKSTTPTPRSGNALAEELRAWEAAKPVFEKACARCHTSTGKDTGKKKLAHFDMDAYPFGGHHAGTIGPEIREVLGLTGAKPTMPDDTPGSVTGDDLAKIKAWADAWDAADKAGAHPAAAKGAHEDDDDDDHD
jgi:hypothetical protein